MKAATTHPSGPILRAVRLAEQDAGALAAWRLEPGLEVCRAAGSVWVRLRSGVEQAERVLGALPALERFVCAPDGSLRLPQGLLPRGRLPEQGWRPATEACPVAAPALPGAALQAPSRAALRLVRSDSPGPATALLADFDAWCRYAIEAPQVRLAAWRLAASREEQLALILGTPLPPLAGTHFYEAGPRVLIPCGFAWTPAIDSAALRTVLEAARTDYVWWREKEGVSVLPEALFVPATRSGARRMLGKLMAEG